jgi:hypothetical protein
MLDLPCLQHNPRPVDISTGSCCRHSDAPIPSQMNEALKEKLRGLGYIE